MKKTLFAVFAALALTTSLFYLTSCGGETDPCEKVECGPHGTCDGVSGTCNCAAGYETDLNGRCDVISREKFKGTFTTFDTCTLSKTATYSVVVNEGSSIDQVVITNFWDQFKNAVTATVKGNTITIARQDPDKDKFFVVGTGTIKDKTITWKYTITDESVTPINSDACRSKWVKQ
jgi:hypothetical protein